MACLETAVLSLEDCLMLEEKVLALGGDLTVLENHYRQLVERNPDIGGGAELIDGLGLVLIYPRMASRSEVEAGGCSPSEALSFFGDCIQGVTFFSEWSQDGALWPTAQAALAQGEPQGFGIGWRRHFAHAPPEKIPRKYWIDREGAGAMPGIVLMQRTNDRRLSDAPSDAWNRTGTIQMSSNTTQEYWQLYPDEFRVALEKIRRLPEELEGWENANVTDGGTDFWAAARLPHHDSADELHAKLTAAAEHCFGDTPSTLEHLSLSLEPDEDHSFDHSRPMVERLLAEMPAAAWSHWEPHNGGVTDMRKVSELREKISRFPMVFEGEDGISVLISSLEFSGEKLVFTRLYKRGGNVLSINFLKRRKIAPKVHKELEKVLGLSLSVA